MPCKCVSCKCQRKAVFPAFDRRAQSFARYRDTCSACAVLPWVNNNLPQCTLYTLMVLPYPKSLVGTMAYVYAASLIRPQDSVLCPLSNATSDLQMPLQSPFQDCQMAMLQNFQDSQRLQQLGRLYASLQQSQVCLADTQNAAFLYSYLGWT